MLSRNLHQVERIFHAALDLCAHDRDAYLAQACSGDKFLYKEVRSLVAALNSVDILEEESALDIGLRVLAISNAQQAIVGTTVRGFKILSVLGKGGMGDVYLGEDLRLERKVALKFLAGELNGDGAAKRRLIDEARVAAKLDHPNICQIYSIEDDAENPFIVMQYVEGITLGDLIHKKPLATKELMNLVRQIIGGFAEAHNHGIVHRDIKPQNIMITPGGQAKILDFGLATSILGKSKNGNSTFRKSSTGRALTGTIRYMSPEQLGGDDVDYRSDVFSLGILLHEMVSGTNPFAREDNADVVAAIVSSVPVSLKRIRFDGLASIIARCLAKNPDKRYASATEILTDLDEQRMLLREERNCHSRCTHTRVDRSRRHLLKTVPNNAQIS